jgi:hypothetical protein
MQWQRLMFWQDTYAFPRPSLRVLRESTQAGHINRILLSKNITPAICLHGVAWDKFKKQTLNATFQNERTNHCPNDSEHKTSHCVR